MMLIAVALSGAALAQAKHQSGTHMHRFTVTAQLNTARGPNAPTVGVETGSLAGSGALVERGKVTSHPTSTIYKFKGTGTDVYSGGTITSTVTGTLRVHADRSASISGHGTYTGGSGSFRSASGKYRFTGSLPAPAVCAGRQLTVQFTGTIWY
jgi:hypothetical protein